MTTKNMRNSSENFTDDSRIGVVPKGKRTPNGILPRCASEMTFSHLQQMERNYCKLGDDKIKRTDKKDKNRRIKVASLNGLNLDERIEQDTDSVFAGRRDVSDPNSIREKQIVSARGSVRGFKNRVRAGLATFLEENRENSRNFRHEEKKKVIIYTTSMTVVRESADKCKAVRNILQTHMVRYEEKDLFMSSENQKELLDRLGTSAIVLPQVFADGIHIGGYDEIQKKNETGELKHIFMNFTKIQLRSHCDTCGGYRFLPCKHCHGSKKSLHRNEFTEEFCALRCMQCDENGLVRCEDCIDQQE